MMSTVIFFITLSLFILNFLLLSSSAQARGCAATQSTGQAWTGPGRGSNNKPKKVIVNFYYYKSL